MLLLNNSPLKYVDDLKYLGVSILSSSAFKCSFMGVKSNFYRCFNGMYSNCCNASSELVACELLRCKCLPILLYASEALTFSAYDTAMFNRLLFRAFAKIFKTYDRDIIDIIRTIFNMSDAAIVLNQRRNKFF